MYFYFFHPFLSLEDAEKLTSHLPRGLVSQKLPGISASVPLLTHLWSNSPCSGTRSESRWRHWSVEVVNWSVLGNFVALDLIFCFRSKSYQEFLPPVRTSEMSSPFASPQPVLELCDCQNHPVSRFGGKFQLSNFLRQICSKFLPSRERHPFHLFGITSSPFLWYSFNTAGPQSGCGQETQLARRRETFRGSTHVKNGFISLSYMSKYSFGTCEYISQHFYQLSL